MSTAHEHNFGFGKTVELGFDDAVEKVRAELAKEGFGVLTEIDVKATLKKKLDVDFRRYIILGACNPPLAHQALSTELEIGLLLPCNVVVYEAASGGTTISMMDPVAILPMVNKPGVEKLADEVKARLERVVANI